MSGINTDHLPGIQFITHRTRKYNPVESAMLALSCGIRWIQFRCKEDVSKATLTAQAIEVQQLCQKYQALFFIDDYVELALTLGADGVHLGKNDMPIDQARRMLGKDFLIGGTANTLEDIENIVQQGGDYVGLGPFRFTQTKAKLSPLLGLEGYAALISEARKKNLNLPVYAIGGILPKDAPELKKCGVNGLAISSALLGSDNPKLTCEQFARYFG